MLNRPFISGFFLDTHPPYTVRVKKSRESRSQVKLSKCVTPSTRGERMSRYLPACSCQHSSYQDRLCFSVAAGKTSAAAEVLLFMCGSCGDTLTRLLKDAEVVRRLGTHVRLRAPWSLNLLLLSYLERNTWNQSFWLKNGSLSIGRFRWREICTCKVLVPIALQ